MLRKLSHHARNFYQLKSLYGTSDSIKIVKALKNDGEIIKLKDQNPIYLRKGTKDAETFEEIYLDRIYDTDLHLKPHTILDGGGNTGLASRFFHARYPAARIAYVEIDPGNVSMARKNLAGVDQITIFENALSYDERYFKIEDPFNATNSYAIVEGTESDHDVTSVSPASIMKQLDWDGIDLVKLDVEGSERELFKNNVDEWLPRVKILMIETHDRMIENCSFDVMTVLNQYGFQLFTTTLGGTLVYYGKEAMAVLKRSL